ncbi:integrase [Bacillus pretiosus]|uniref:integrase n=1 Tax=Bacillus pretiosus TaxID=2983392 RepID=UPI003D64998C
MNTLFVEDNIFNLDEFSEERFNFDNSIQIAKENLENVMGDKWGQFDFLFEDEVWILNNNLLDGKRYIKFNKVDILAGNISKDEIAKLKMILRCWVVSLISSDYSVGSIGSGFSFVCNTIVDTLIFKKELLQDFKSSYNEKSDSLRANIACSMINFLDFSEEFEYGHLYAEFLSGQTYNRASVRRIPTSQDCIKFSWILEDFYKNIDKNDKQYLFYYPIQIWWKFTTVIPIRIGEFLSLERNSIEKINNKYYMILPRIKQKFISKKIQVIDRIEITDKMYELISEYIKLTEKNKKSNFLFSKSVHKSLFREEELKSDELIKCSDRFSNDIFRSLLISFYKNIIMSPPYNLTVRDIGEDSEAQIRNSRVKGLYFDIERMLRPNDTRHLAFLSLMLQGFHPVEIARLGGHQTINAQRHYQKHEYFLTDSGIAKLMRMFELTGEGFTFQVLKKNINSTVTPIGRKFKEDFIFKPALSTEVEYKKMEVGYCTAPVKVCETHCFLCKKYWRVSKEEFLQNRHIIERWMASERKEIQNLNKTLYNIHSQLIKDEYSEINIKLTENLAVNSQKLKSMISNFGEFKETYQEWLEDEYE